MLRTTVHAINRRLVLAGLTAAFALALLVGMNPSGASAYKSKSLSCTTLESGFIAADAASARARMRGDAAGVEFWNSVSMGLQGVYLDLNCSIGEIEGEAV